MQTGYLIIGQGISGTFLSWYLQQEGKDFLVIDKEDKQSSSRIAAGIINPVTGRRHVTVWMAEDILPFAWEAYQQIGHELTITAISHKNLLDFFPSPQMRLSFLQRAEEGGPYVHSYPEQNHFNHLFNYEFGCGEIRPVYTAHLETLLPAWRTSLKGKGILLEEDFEIQQLSVSANSIQYKDIRAEKIIFCDGAGSFDSPYFKQLPFAPNKGELLLAEIPDLPVHHIYKKGMMLAPLVTPGLWWIGSGYEWEFEHPDPTPAFRKRTEEFLENSLKVSFSIVDHLAGIRPATLERRPFVGIHPHYPSIGIVNGMGTKGCSLAPFFAKQLTDHLLYGQPLHPEADINRYRKILSRE